MEKPLTLADFFDLTPKGEPGDSARLILELRDGCRLASSFFGGNGKAAAWIEEEGEKAERELVELN